MVIHYDLKNNGFVTLKVFDILGKEIAAIVDGYKTAGSYDATFLASEYNLSSGVYFYKLTAGNFTDMKKMTLIK
jgi:hypothetical protein